MAASQVYGLPLCPCATWTSQATISAVIRASPESAVACRSICLNRSSPLTVRPRMVSLRPLTSRRNKPKPAMTARPNTPEPSWPPSQLATSTATPSPRQNSGMNHFERMSAWLPSLIIEHLLDRDAEVAGERDRQRERRGVPVVLDRVDRLP